MPDTRRRRGYLDWLRGIAVLIMIEAHVVDSWTAEPYRQSREFGWAIILGGFGAPLFLFLAGAAVALSASAKARAPGGSEPAAARAVMRRGLEIFGLAFLFRLQAWLLSGGPATALLRVDILNIMGPAIVMAAAVWGAARSPRTRAIAFGAATAAVALVTPPVRSAAWLAALPDPIEGYLRPIPGLTNFVMFPWAGFAFAGALVGVLIDWRGTVAVADEARLQRYFAIAGVALVAIGFGGSYLPSIYERSSFWTSSPSYFAMRAGILTAAVPVAFAWERRSERHRWSPVRQLGRTSLFIYWIHVEMVYGALTRPLHRSLSLMEALAALVAFTVLLLGVSMAKDRVVTWSRRRAAERRGQPVSPL